MCVCGGGGGGVSEDYSNGMILCTLKFTLFVVRETSK